MSEYVDDVLEVLSPFDDILKRDDDCARAYAEARKKALDLAHELDGDDKCIGCNEWIVDKRYLDEDGWLCEECADACREETA
jgi:hypothetical protein